MSRTGTLKERKVKLVWKNHGSPNSYWYAEPGERVTWAGDEGSPENYGGRRVLWCTLWSGEDIGLEESEVNWDEAE